MQKSAFSVHKNSSSVRMVSHHTSAWIG